MWHPKEYLNNDNTTWRANVGWVKFHKTLSPNEELQATKDFWERENEPPPATLSELSRLYLHALWMHTCNKSEERK